MDALHCPDCGHEMVPMVTKIDHWKCVTPKCRSKVEQLALFDIKEVTRRRTRGRERDDKMRRLQGKNRRVEKIVEPMPKLF